MVGVWWVECAFVQKTTTNRWYDRRCVFVCVCRPFLYTKKNASRNHVRVKYEIYQHPNSTRTHPFTTATSGRVRNHASVSLSWVPGCKKKCRRPKA